MCRRHTHRHRTWLSISLHGSACMRVHHAIMMMMSPVSLLVPVSWRSALAPRARVDRPRAPVLLLQSLQHLFFSPDRGLAGPLPEGEGQHPGAASSDDPRNAGLEPPPGVSVDESTPRDRPEGRLQKPKEPTSAMLKNHSRLKNPAEPSKFASKALEHVTCIASTPYFKLASAGRHS